MPRLPFPGGLHSLTPRTAAVPLRKSSLALRSSEGRHASLATPLDNNAPHDPDKARLLAQAASRHHGGVPAENARKVFLPNSSIHSLALVAFVEPVFNWGHRVAFLFLMLGIDTIQVMITYYLHYVTMGLLKSGAGCECNPTLQWLCIFSFVLIVWQEVVQTLDSIEFLLSKEEMDAPPPLPSNYSPLGSASTPPAPPAAGPAAEAGTPPPEPRAGHRPAETQEDTEPDSTEEEWSACFGADVLCCSDAPDDWQLCSENSCWAYSEQDLFARQFSGFRISAVPTYQRWVIVTVTGVSKLAIEGALLYVGSLYIATSLDNEEVITSVVAVTFICTLDDQILSSLVPGKMSDALRHTFISWLPKTRSGRLWVRLRTDWRMFVDAIVVLSVSGVMFRVAAFHAACHHLDS